MTSGTSISLTRDPATDKQSSFIFRCVVLCIQKFCKTLTLNLGKVDIILEICPATFRIGFSLTFIKPSFRIGLNKSGIFVYILRNIPDCIEDNS